MKTASDVKTNYCQVDETQSYNAAAMTPTEYDHPFAAKDLVLAQVGWRDRETGTFYGLGEYVHDPITVEEAAKPMFLQAVYVAAGHHYKDPAP